MGCQESAKILCQPKLDFTWQSITGHGTIISETEAPQRQAGWIERAFGGSWCSALNGASPTRDPFRRRSKNLDLWPGASCYFVSVMVSSEQSMRDYSAELGSEAKKISHPA